METQLKKKTLRRLRNSRSRIVKQVKIAVLATGVTTVISPSKNRQVIEVFADINPIFLRKP